jgi:hypothetical protein
MKRHKRLPMGAAVVFLLAGAVLLMTHQAVGSAVFALGVIFLAVGVGRNRKA